ncbi:MAG: hypothetical protein GX958_01005 [Desulfitobacterium sp.]|nr:hypothetical protein [Desulfitobacterium sp.]
MAQKAFIFNPNRCLGCRACQAACSLNHNLPTGVFIRKVVPVEFERGGGIIKYYLSKSCNHCANPECFRLCPNHAFRKRRDGIVVYNGYFWWCAGKFREGSPATSVIFSEPLYSSHLGSLKLPSQGKQSKGS